MDQDEPACRLKSKKYFLDIVFFYSWAELRYVMIQTCLD